MVIHIWVVTVCDKLYNGRCVGIPTREGEGQLELEPFIGSFLPSNNGGYPVEQVVPIRKCRYC